MNAFFQASWLVCLLSHFFELPSIKKKSTFYCIRYTGRFLLRHKIVLPHALMIKLCTMSEIGPCTQQQCKAYCITHIPITLSGQCIGIRKANLPTDTLHTVWSTCPRWWALSKVSKLALSCLPKASQMNFLLRFFCGILCIWRTACVMCYRMWKRHVPFFFLSSNFCISGIFRIHISGQPYHIISDMCSKEVGFFMQFMQVLMLSGVVSAGRKQTNLYLYTE